MTKEILFKTIRKHRYFLIVLIVGFVLRVYKYDELFLYGHDHDLAGWFVRDVVFNKHLRLIGQETSTAGIYIGPIYYYLLIPFYALTKFDPIGSVIFITIFGIFSIWSFYFVFGKVFGKKEALIATVIYAISFYTVHNDREVFPTTPVITWGIWYFYSLSLLLKAKFKKGFTIAGILVGLIWHLNFALVLLLPLLMVAIILSKKIPKIADLWRGIFSFVFLSLPLIVFELKHNFIQVRALISSLTTDQGSVYTGVEQFKRVIYLLGKNASGLLMGSFDILTFSIVFIAIMILFTYLIYKKVVDRKLGILLVFWVCFYVIFFSLYSKNLSEYYLNGTIVFFIIVFTILIASLFKSKRYKLIGLSMMVIFAVVNLGKFFGQEINRNGYVERKEIISQIHKDADNNDYPCVSISYITSPGYELGYRYFLWLYDLKIKKPDSLAPVYTIVFPLRDDIKVDKTVGAIGLIYPDYSSYNTEGIQKSCEGENVNVTEPMWGLPM